jgi:hypothetical protein
MRGVCQIDVFLSHSLPCLRFNPATAGKEGNVPVTKKCLLEMLLQDL